MGNALSGIFNFLMVCFFIALLGVGYFVFTLFKDKKTFKTTEKPSISWELKAKGQKVDTIWIYKFN